MIALLLAATLAGGMGELGHATAAEADRALALERLRGELDACVARTRASFNERIDWAAVDRALEVAAAATNCDLIYLRRERSRLAVRFERLDFEPPDVKYRLLSEYRVVEGAIRACGVRL